MSCGAPLTTAVAAGQRKTVTALFCDVVGSTAMGEQRDPEVVRRSVEAWFTQVRQALERHGGTVEKFVGDAVLAVFGVPAVHEDDALRACRAALEIVAVTPLPVRIGIETGQVFVGDVARGSTFASGAAVNVAARLQAAADPGQVLVGPRCRLAVADRADLEPLPPLRLKGFAAPVRPSRLTSVAGPSTELRPLQLLPLVGRDRDLERLREDFRAVVQGRSCRVVTLLGVAGMGKTRLTSELVAALAGSAVLLRARCPAYGDGVTWWPVVEIVRQVTGTRDTDVPEVARAALRHRLRGDPEADEVVARLAPALGLGGTSSAEDVTWSLGRLLGVVARDAPVLLVVEDMHWAEAGIVQLLADLGSSLTHVPLLVLVTARPEFLDEERASALLHGDEHSTHLLQPLSDDDIRALSSAAAGRPLSEDLVVAMRSVADGNPLYVTQYVAMLRDEGRLNEAGVAAAGRPGQLAVPPTVSSLIEARLDRLPEGDRAVLGAAAVIGQFFFRQALAEILPDRDVMTGLAHLEDRAFVHPEPSEHHSLALMAFGHALVRDAAYAALPKTTRADLHEDFARWCHRNAGGRVRDDVVGSHLEAAVNFRVELGFDDARTRELEREASARLEAAGRDAWVSDPVVASALLGRADRLRVDETPSRWALRIELAGALRSCYRFAEAVDVVRQVVEAASAAGDDDWVITGRVAMGNVAAEPDIAGLAIAAEEALRRFQPSSHHLFLVHAHQALAEVANASARNDERLRHGLLAAEEAARHGDSRMANHLRIHCLRPMVLGRTRADEGLELATAWADEAVTRRDRGVATMAAAAFATMLGRPEAPTLWATAREVGASSSSRQLADIVDWYAAFVGLVTGRAATSLELFGPLVEVGEETGQLGAFSTDAALCAIALLHLGSTAEATALVGRALLATPPDDAVSMSLGHTALAWVAASAGDRQAAEEALAVADSTSTVDLPLNQTIVDGVAAEVAELFGDDETVELRRRAAILGCRHKGNVVGADWHHARLVGLPGHDRL